MTGELKPCPFCGGVAKIEYDWSGAVGQYVMCSGCGAEVDDIDTWNTRAERTCKQIDVTETRKPFTTHMTECSECGGVLAVDEMPAPNYCPNCGAKVVDE